MRTESPASAAPVDSWKPRVNESFENWLGRLDQLIAEREENDYVTKHAPLR